MITFSGRDHLYATLFTGFIKGVHSKSWERCLEKEQSPIYGKLWRNQIYFYAVKYLFGTICMLAFQDRLTAENFTCQLNL